MEKNWLICENKFDAQKAMAYEGLFTLGSGYLHTRGSYEEKLGSDFQNITNPRPAFANASSFKQGEGQFSKWGTYVPGIFAHHPNLNEEMVNLPYFLGIESRVAGEKLDLLESSISDYQRQLNLKTASLKQALTWQTGAGDLEIEYERFISGPRAQLSVQKILFRAKTQEIHLFIKTGIDADVRTNGFDHFVSTEISHSEKLISSVVKTNENSFYDKQGRLSNVSGGDTIRTVCQLFGDATDWTYSKEERRGFWTSEVIIPAGQSFCLEKRTAVSTSRDLDIYRPAEQVLAETEALSFEQLFAEHKQHWQELWGKSDVKIVSKNPQDRSQLALRASLFHLLRCQVPHDARVAIDAKGTAGDIYYGRYFWDTEIYLLPFYLYTDAARAKTLVDFRVNSLAGAKRNAARDGYAGARYSWESDSQGNDCCPPGNWQYRDHEIHISADIVYAFTHYAANTSEEYLKDPAVAQTIVEIARYWTQRVDWRDGVPHLLGVMGPDEYTALISDNAYSNYMVKYALRVAAQYGKFAGASAAELAEFEDIAQKLPILYDKQGVILQCKEFEDLAEPQFEKFWPGYAAGQAQGHFAQYVSQERLYRTKSLKQADVLMLAFLFASQFSKAEIQAIWDKYVPYTTHDSSLSLGVHALLAKRLGMDDLAWTMMQKCLFSDLDVTGEGAAEGIHIAGCGMNWQMLVFGMGGLSTALQSEFLRVEPHLPEQWESLSFPFVFKGQSLYFEVKSDEVTIENRSARAFECWISGKLEQVASQEKASFELGKI